MQWVLYAIQNGYDDLHRSKEDEFSVEYEYILACQNYVTFPFRNNTVCCQTIVAAKRHI